MTSFSGTRPAHDTKGNMKQQGIFVVLAAIAIQLTLGIAYIWSVFQTGIAERIFGGNNASAALTFSILLALLGIGGIIGGNLAARYSTRLVVFVGGMILSAGFFLASFTPTDFPRLLWLGYGLMGGVGMGFTYSTTIACAQKWYPHKKGLVTGIIVSALGFGGVVFTPVAEWLIATFGGTGAGELPTFRVLSGLFLTVCTVGSLFMKNPPEGWMADRVVSKAAIGARHNHTPKDVLKTPQFYLVLLTFMLACMGGLMIIGFAKPIAIGKGLTETATIGVVVISLFNSLGRLVWGAVSDKIGRMNTLILLLVGTAGLSLLVNPTGGYWLYVLIACIGFLYGGFLSNFPSLTADLFGPKYMATNYGLVLVGFGAGAVLASQIGGYYKNIADVGKDIGLMSPAFIIASVCAGAGIVLMIVLKLLARRSEQKTVEA